MIELINPYVVKILIAAKDGDSVRVVSKKIKESYGWTYKWVTELEKIGVLQRKGQEIKINKDNQFYKKLKNFVISSLGNNLNLDDAYILPNLSGLNYMFTGIDAIFIWTKGGYNIGRSMDSYPVFIEVLKKDKEGWENYFFKLNIKYTFKNERKKGTYFIIGLTENIDREYSEGIPVLPLIKAIEWAKKYSFNFQPALEMLDEMYGIKTGVKYK